MMAQLELSLEQNDTSVVSRIVKRGLSYFDHWVKYTLKEHGIELPGDFEEMKRVVAENGVELEMNRKEMKYELKVKGKVIGTFSFNKLI